jgi:AcrR family transcriptional regulator
MEEKRVYIINAAESQFVRFGFRKTTMEDIAKAAGIGKATLYYYFKSKEEIFTAMAGQIAQVGLQTVAEAAKTGKTPQDKLSIFGRTLAQFVKEKIEYYAAFREEVLELFPSFRKKQTNAEGYGRAVLREILQEGVQCGVFAISDVTATARLLQTLMQEFMIRVIVEENQSAWEDDIQRFLDLIMKGLETRD